MYNFLILLISILYTAECANYQRYGDTTNRYPTYTYSSTISNLYNNYPYRTSSYGSDIASFPEVTRYPNYNPTYSTSNYNTYNTPGSGGIYNQPGYTTQRYADQYQTYGSGAAGGYNGYSSYESPFMTNMNGLNNYCVNRSPQTGIWVDNLMGMWYGVEFIQHLGGDARLEYARTCIVIHIAEPLDRPSTENQLYHVQHISAKFRQVYRHLRLLWDEAGQTIEYPLYFRNDSAGYWQVFDGQNGTLTRLPNYQQFSGTIQVLKAVNGHLVLNFCQEAANGRPAQLYSVLFSREPGILARWEVESIHSLLQTKKLSVASRRMVCGNSADRPLFSIILSILICVLAITINWS